MGHRILCIQYINYNTAMLLKKFNNVLENIKIVHLICEMKKCDALSMSVEQILTLFVHI